MGQLLIVQGPDAGETEELFRSAVAIFESIHKVKPVGQACTPQGSVAAFPMRKAPLAGLVQDGVGGWICGAGTWFFERTAAEAGLRRLALHPARKQNDSSWLKELDGAFAIALGDSETGELRILTDLLGTLHIYAARSGSSTIISTSSMALAAITRPDWDMVGCRQFLATGTVFESRTLFDGIEKLAPATVYTFCGGQRKSQAAYWNLADVMYDRAPRRTDVPELAAALRDALTTVQRNFPGAAMDLTGGFDSRAVLGAALQAGVRFETVVNGLEDSPDVISAGRIAREFGLVHHRFHFPSSAPEWESRVAESVGLCDGEYDAVLYASVFATHTGLARKYDCSINGSNGEIAKGYWWELLFPFTGKRGHFDPRTIASRRFVAGGEASGLLAHEFSEELPELFAGIIRRANAGLEDHPNTALMDNVYLRLRMQRWQGRIASATSRIWPCVSPFCFRGPMEAALAAPPSLRGNNRMSRRLIEFQDPKLAALPLAEGYPALPWRLSTAHRFGPLYKEFSRGVIRRAFLTMHLPSPFPSTPAAVRPGEGLWDHPLVRDLLVPAEMKTSVLYNRAKLISVLEQSRAGSSSATARASRILTLEMLARAVQTLG
jgi:asparagine synthase (glutamine-hydrolysing)